MSKTHSRGDFDPSKARHAANTEVRTLGDAIKGADVFLGCSSAGVLKPEMFKEIDDTPLILALANPDPEIRPEGAKKMRPDAIIATGRPDYDPPSAPLSRRPQGIQIPMEKPKTDRD